MKYFALSESDRAAVQEPLQASLVDLIDLGLAAKQAHWNLRGPRFKSLHEQLDEVVDLARTTADDVAERIAALGFPADGRSSQVANASRLGGFPSGTLGLRQTADEISRRMVETVKGLRAGQAVSADADPVTEDLFIGAIASFEKALWMMQAQLEDSDEPAPIADENLAAKN